MVLLLRLIFFSTCLLFHALRSCLNALLTGFNGRANNITSVDLSDRDLVSPACAPPIRLSERFCAAPSSYLIVGLIKSMRPRSMSNILVTLATAGSIVVASPSPHHHHDAHLHECTIKTVEVPCPTVIAYDFNGQLVDQSEVYAGVKDGTLQLKDGTVDPPACPSQTTSVDPIDLSHCRGIECHAQHDVFACHAKRLREGGFQRQTFSNPGAINQHVCGRAVSKSNFVKDLHGAKQHNRGCPISN